jgi:pimeloyl-ACP methyl ester carboxylesterase
MDTATGTQSNLDRRTTSGLVDVGATRLHHEVRGSGPPVLFISGATGDAGEWMHVAPTLAEGFTVVTYDRRGYSRSPRPDGWTSTSMTEQAGDAAALLRALDLAPAVVVGHSGGGSIACALVVHHPEVVRHAVLYEPALVAVVPPGTGMFEGLLSATVQAMAQGGPRRGMEVFMRGNTNDDVVASIDPALYERCLDNGTVFFSIEWPMFSTFVPDRERMRAAGVPLTVVTGVEDRGRWYEAAAAWLADGTGAERAELPGGHVGYASHPAEFVAGIRRIIGQGAAE